MPGAFMVVGGCWGPQDLLEMLATGSALIPTIVFSSFKSLAAGDCAHLRVSGWTSAAVLMSCQSLVRILHSSADARMVYVLMLVT